MDHIREAGELHFDEELTRGESIRIPSISECEVDPPVRASSCEGKDLLKVLSRLGCRAVRQRGSHVRLKCATPTGEHAFTIPLHDEIAPGTLNDILSKVSLWKGIQKVDLISLFQ